MGRPAAALLSLAALLGLHAAPGPPEEKPRKTRLVETAGTRLAQLDVSVSGPEEAVEQLTKEDFEIKVAMRPVTEFTLDRTCREPAAAASHTPEPGRPEAPAPQAVKPQPISYLFYFDMPYLTMAGRQRAMDLSKELLPKLIAGESRAMIVSNAKAVTTIAPFTSNVNELLGAVQRLESNHEQWDQYPQLEQSRLTEVQNALTKGAGLGTASGIEHAIGLARIYYQEDRWRGERDIRRLSMTLGLLTEVEPPKAVLYFADTMRQNPGDLYLNIFSDAVLERLQMKPFESHPLDRVIQEASAHGIRFYPVQAEGLVAPSRDAGWGSGGSSVAANNRVASMIGVHDAQKALKELALETGGQAFLNGVPAQKIAENVLSDLSCMYLISFDPVGFPEDEPLPVKVQIRQPRVKAQVRGQIVIQGESSRRTSKLMAAFLTPEATRSDVPIRASLIPTGYKDGVYSALVQVAVAGGATTGSTWDLGTSLVSRERVRDEGSGRITVNAAGAPVIFEREMSFSPGPYELVSVAHDATTGQVASRRDEGTWPDPDAAEATVGPIAVLQPATGAFLRDGKAHTSGTLAQSEQDPVRADRATALVGIVCRSKGRAGPLQIERSLHGESSASFPPMEIDMGEDRCAQFRDLVPAGTMTSGFFRYEVRVVKGETEIARGERSFPAVRPETEGGSHGQGSY